MAQLGGGGSADTSLNDLISRAVGSVDTADKNYKPIIQSKDAHAIESKYGNFEFPSIPENGNVQNETLMATRQPMRPPSGVRATNKFLAQADPMTTTQSV